MNVTKYCSNKLYILIRYIIINVSEMYIRNWRKNLYVLILGKMLEMYKYMYFIYFMMSTV